MGQEGKMIAPSGLPITGEECDMQKGDYIGLAIVITILVGIGLFFAYAPKAPVVVYSPVEITGSSVTVNPETTERSIQVSAEIKQPGFVTVHEAIGEAPGPVIGQTPLLTVGSHPNLTIETTGLEPLYDYFILLFVDDGDGIYEAGIDLPVMSDGQVIKQKVSL